MSKLTSLELLERAVADNQVLNCLDIRYLNGLVTIVRNETRKAEVRALVSGSRKDRTIYHKHKDIWKRVSKLLDLAATKRE